MWRTRLPGNYYASVAAAAGRIYFCNLAGETTVVAAGSQLQVLDTNDLEEPVFGSFAFSEGELFIRGQKHVYCIGPGTSPPT